MPLGIVSDSEFDSELSNVDVPTREVPKSVPITTPNSTIINDSIVTTIEKGRGKDNLNVPDGLRKIIGEESVINGRQAGLELARQFGISASSVSAYDNGAHSTASYETKTDVAGHIDAAKLRVAKRARNKLMQALHALTPEKIEEAKAREIAGIAKDMSVIIKNMEPDTPATNNNLNVNKPTFVFFTPQLRTEEAYDVTYAKE